MSATRDLIVDGRARHYVLHVPATCDVSTPQPVLMALHGALSNPRLMERFTGLTDFADEHRFILVYPAGTGNTASTLTWNGGTCCGYAQKNQVDDVAYFRALLADLEQILPVDHTRVYLTGMSNGAHMTYRLASEMAERFAAIACVAGPMAIEQCRPARPVPLVHIHGTDDAFAPFAGGQGAKSIFGVSFPSIEDTIRQWVHANRCDIEPQIDSFPDRAGDGTSVGATTIARATTAPKCCFTSSTAAVTPGPAGRRSPPRSAPPPPISTPTKSSGVFCNGTAAPDCLSTRAPPGEWIQ
jgi:polyhydroxybutyrate depolymerase